MPTINVAHIILYCTNDKLRITYVIHKDLLNLYSLCVPQITYCTTQITYVLCISIVLLCMCYANFPLIYLSFNIQLARQRFCFGLGQAKTRCHCNMPDVKPTFPPQICYKKCIVQGKMNECHVKPTHLAAKQY